MSLPPWIRRKLRSGAAIPAAVQRHVIWSSFQRSGGAAGVRAIEIIEPRLCRSAFGGVAFAGFVVGFAIFAWPWPRRRPSPTLRRSRRRRRPPPNWLALLWPSLPLRRCGPVAILGNVALGAGLAWPAIEVGKAGVLARDRPRRQMLPLEHTFHGSTPRPLTASIIEGQAAQVVAFLFRPDNFPTSRLVVPISTSW